MLCNANPKRKGKQKIKKKMITKDFEMKHKDHFRKTQLD